MTSHRPSNADVLVIGAGNAGFCAALSAAERGKRVVMLERGTEETAGGNSYYTAGATRVAHDGLDDLRDVVEDDPRHAVTTVPAYSAAEYVADLAKVTGGRSDPAMSEVVASEALDGVRWLRRHGLRYRLMYERQAYARPDGSYLFWGGLHIGNVGGGRGLIEDHTAAAARVGVSIRYGMRATELLLESGRVVGVRAIDATGERVEVGAQSVILAAGGFEANADLRERHLGPGWRNARVRGTPHNTGEMIEAALAIGARRGGDWSTCHSVAWDAFAVGNESNRMLTNQLTRGGYPLGIVVNALGNRFVDEGADFRNYTYARYGRDILAQPGSLAFQIFDATQRPLLREEEYDMPGVSLFAADTIAELAGLIGAPPRQLMDTVDRYNASIDRSKPFDPNTKDGRAAFTTPPKSNWAAAIETGPFYAFPVTCGITFTFGGLAADLDGRVLNAEGHPIPGLLVAGEMLGGLFSGNYPGGSGLAAGIVFGRRAGAAA